MRLLSVPLKRATRNQASWATRLVSLRLQSTDATGQEAKSVTTTKEQALSRRRRLILDQSALQVASYIGNTTRPKKRTPAKPARSASSPPAEKGTQPKTFGDQPRTPGSPVSQNRSASGRPPPRTKPVADERTASQSSGEKPARKFKGPANRGDATPQVKRPPYATQSTRPPFQSSPPGFNRGQPNNQNDSSVDRKGATRSVAEMMRRKMIKDTSDFIRSSRMSKKTEVKEDADKLTVHRPKATALSDLRRVLDPTAPFSKAVLPLTPPTLDFLSSTYQYVLDIERLRGLPASEALTATQRANNLLTRNPMVTIERKAKCLERIQKLAAEGKPARQQSLAIR